MAEPTTHPIGAIIWHGPSDAYGIVRYAEDGRYTVELEDIWNDHFEPGMTEILERVPASELSAANERDLIAAGNGTVTALVELRDTGELVRSIGAGNGLTTHRIIRDVSGKIRPRCGANARYGLLKLPTVVSQDAKVCGRCFPEGAPVADERDEADRASDRHAEISSQPLTATEERQREEWERGLGHIETDAEELVAIRMERPIFDVESVSSASERQIESYRATLRSGILELQKALEASYTYRPNALGAADRPSDHAADVELVIIDTTGLEERPIGGGTPAEVRAWLRATQSEPTGPYAYSLRGRYELRRQGARELLGVEHVRVEGALAWTQRQLDYLTAVERGELNRIGEAL